jgi:cellobiose phosphorylase
VVRKFRNSIYNITINNPKKVCKGVKSLILDGKLLNGNIVPNQNDGKNHIVEVELG